MSAIERFEEEGRRSLLAPYAIRSPDMHPRGEADRRRGTAMGRRRHGERRSRRGSDQGRNPDMYFPPTVHLGDDCPATKSLSSSFWFVAVRRSRSATSATTTRLFPSEEPAQGRSGFFHGRFCWRPSGASGGLHGRSSVGPAPSSADFGDAAGFDRPWPRDEGTSRVAARLRRKRADECSDEENSPTPTAAEGGARGKEMPEVTRCRVRLLRRRARGRMREAPPDTTRGRRSEGKEWA